jgi:uncharacterized protein YbjT (DUF2867 family)
MRKQVLITGGAGFIGSHLADELLEHGYRVRVLDSLSAQVHGKGGKRPEYLDPEVELVVGDVRDGEAVQRALRHVDAVYHLAAAVGVGQSMYEIAHYTQTNNLGTAVLLEALARRPGNSCGPGLCGRRHAARLSRGHPAAERTRRGWSGAGGACQSGAGTQRSGVSGCSGPMLFLGRRADPV